MVADWSDQVALVSGAGSERGIGFAIAKRLGSLGVRLIITGSSARIHDRVEELRVAGFEVHGRAADLSEEDQVLELTTWAESIWGENRYSCEQCRHGRPGSPGAFFRFSGHECR